MNWTLLKISKPKKNWDIDKYQTFSLSSKEPKQKKPVNTIDDNHHHNQY